MFEPEWRQPDPPGVEPVKSHNPWIPLIALTIVLALAVVAFWVPIPILWKQVPGLVRDVETLVTIEGAPDYSSEGSLYLTTVSFDDHVTFAEWVMSGFDDESVVVFRDDVTGGGTEEDLLEAARIQMQQSKEAARNVALGELGLLRPAVRIARIAPDSPAEGKFEIGDVLQSVAGEPVYTVCAAQSAIAQQTLGEELDIVVERDGRRREVTVVPEALDPQRPDAPVVGVILREGDPTPSDAPHIEIDSGKIGGPSAGLIFSLAVYDRLTPDDMTAGREIAGTGGIRCDGTVEPIGGIEQKVIAAERKGAEIFLAPADNFEAAREVAEDIEVVSVERFDDAVEYLAEIS